MEFEYKVRESTIVVRGRPKAITVHDREKAFGGEDETKGFDAFLCVTDTFIFAPAGKTLVWFPWNEGRMPIPELYYACNHTLNWWTYYAKLKKIMIFCDAGSHRSVTVFGAFLMTYFDKLERERIVKERIALKKYDYTDAQLATYAHPLEYIESYLEDFPADRLLFKAMRKDYLGRLDSHSQGIYRLVKERYGDNRHEEEILTKQGRING